ncbi:MAG: putative TIM-barrel fold metal-dependent hydrolase [Limisphaerales bacterium]|jgi:predicted TIM-barrel fold metal-dependent hydrolase
MSYANGKLICDADSHLMELPDFLTAFADADVRSLLPDLGAALTGQFEPGQYSREVGHSAEQVAKLMALGDNLTKGPKWHEALGAFNGNERAQALDQLGFAKQVIFSSFCARLIFDADTDDTAYGAAEAHNRAMADYCDADDRLMGVAMVPLQDVSRAQEEIERALELGLRAVWIPADAPGGRSPGHPSHDPLWARLEEAGVPFILHVGSAPLTIGDAWMNDGKPEAMSARGGAEVIGSKDLTTIHFAAHRFLSTLVLDGVLEAFPRLKGGVIEIGAGWVPDMLRRLDHAVDIWSRSEPQLAKMNRTPSEQAKDQLRFTPYPFEDVATLVGESCPELYLFSSDYPHAEGGRDPLGRFSRTTADLSEVDRQKFFAGNFFDLYPDA